MIGWALVFVLLIVVSACWVKIEYQALILWREFEDSMKWREESEKKELKMRDGMQ